MTTDNQPPSFALNRLSPPPARPNGKIAPCDVFAVPDQVRHLSPEQVSALEKAFRAWRDEARRADSRQSRARMLCIFLLLRHTGARLKEILDLDDEADLDLAAATARLGMNGSRRESPLPRTVCRELSIFLDGPMAATLRGRAFAMDPGYVRRVFYARAAEAGLPRDLAAPRVLRSTRTVELLRSGVPLSVVREVLGQSADLTAIHQSFSQGDVRDIMRRLALDDVPVKSSARNTFQGHIISLRNDGLMAEVEIKTASGLRLFAMITIQSLETLELDTGSPVAATVKAPMVGLCRRGGQGRVNSRNQFMAKITRIRGTRVMAEVSGAMDDGTGLCALVSARRLKDMRLSVGDQAKFCFKSLSIVLHAL